jgi:ATP-dependent Clp protease ATP-binding subunit ClpA
VFDRFTELAKRAIVASEDAALSLRHDFIGTGHLLLGLISTAGTAGEVLRQHGVELSRARDVTVRQLEAAGAPATGGQAARDALSMIGIDVYEIQRRADAIFGPGTFRFPRPAFTPGAKTALELTLREATDLGHERIDTEDMLLGLLAETRTGTGTEGDSEGEGEPQTESEGVALAILSAFDVNPAALRQSVLDRLAQPAP